MSLRQILSVNKKVQEKFPKRTEEKEEEPKRRFLDDDNDYDIPPFLRDRDNF